MQSTNATGSCGLVSVFPDTLWCDWIVYVSAENSTSSGEDRGSDTREHYRIIWEYELCSSEDMSPNENSNPTNSSSAETTTKDGYNELRTVLPRTVRLPWKESVVQLSIGIGHGIMLTDGGRIISFGYNSYGQLGVPLLAEAAKWTSLMDITSRFPSAYYPVQVTAGPQQTFVVMLRKPLDTAKAYNGRDRCSRCAVYSFGRNHVGQLGCGTASSYTAEPCSVSLVSSSFSVLLLTEQFNIVMLFVAE